MASPIQSHNFLVYLDGHAFNLSSDASSIVIDYFIRNATWRKRERVLEVISIVITLSSKIVWSGDQQILSRGAYKNSYKSSQHKRSCFQHPSSKWFPKWACRCNRLDRDQDKMMRLGRLRGCCRDSGCTIRERRRGTRHGSSTRDQRQSSRPNQFSGYRRRVSKKKSMSSARTLVTASTATMSSSMVWKERYGILGGQVGHTLLLIASTE